MAKLTLTDVSNITGAEAAAIAAINANWDAIIAAIDNSLSLDGTSPNSLSADLDLDDNDILNVGTLETDNLTIGGVSIEGAGFQWSGDWVTATSYVVNDTVENNGSAYVCILAHTAASGNEPGVGGSWETYWDLVAQKGDTGATGPAGAGSGDMLESVYDPTSVSGDAFDMDNMVEGSTTKILTGTERTKLSGIETSADVTDATNVDAAGAAMLDQEDQTLTGGVIVTSKDLGTASSGTVTPDPGDRPNQHYINGGAHTLAPSSNVGTTVVDITNNGSAGTITTSGFTQVVGDSFTTTDTHKFRCSISVGDAGSLLAVVAMQ